MFDDGLIISAIALAGAVAAAAGFWLGRRARRGDRAFDPILRRPGDLPPGFIVDDQTELFACSKPHSHILTFVSDGYCRYFGKTRKQLLGTCFLDHIPADERDDVAVRIAGLSPANPVAYMEHSVIFPDGETGYAQWSHRAISDDAGKIVEIQAVGHDVTESRKTELALRDSEERYRLLVESSPDAILVAGADRRIRFANSAAVELFRAETPAQLVGVNVLDLVVAGEREDVDLSLAKILEGATQPFFARRRVRLDGSEFDSESRGTPFTWDGEPATLIITRDDTARRQTEAQLRQSQKMEAVGQLTGGIAHDFNNILAIILGNAELLKERVDEDGLTDPVIRAATRGAELTQKLLAFSRQQPLWPKVINLNDTVYGMAGVLRRTLSEAIETRFLTSENLWTVKADESQVENLLLNVAINARNAMLDGGVLAVRTENRSLDDRRAAGLDLPPGDYVALTVTDTGSGIAPEVLEHVFEPFFTTREVGEGSGLGLSMAYAFAKQSGGQLAIKSEVGRGTSVTLYLPRALPDEAQDAAGETSLGTSTVPGKTVLVVEDEPDMRQIAVTLLGDLGYEVIEADTGPAAIEVLRQKPQVDVLLTDVVLRGGMSGSELAMASKDSHPGITILLMSGYADEGISADIGGAENIGFLRKPFSKENLARSMRDALRGK